MSVQEAMNQEYAQLKKARNEKRLQKKYNEMNNEELWNYVRSKWEEILTGAAA